MKNQNSISKPTVIIKPPPSVSAIPSSKKDKIPIKKMDYETNQEQQVYDDDIQPNNDFSLNINETPTTTTADSPSTLLTDKVKTTYQIESLFQVTINLFYQLFNRTANGYIMKVFN
jgi:hypothetical protein